jgi:hypothetical protein
VSVSVDFNSVHSLFLQQPINLIMRNFLLLTCLTLFSLTANAQCNDFFPIKNGTEWTFENYNAKGKATGKNHQKVTAFTPAGSGFTATINSIMYNEKGKEQAKGDLIVSCENGVITMDMRKFIPEEQYKAFGSTEVKVESENLQFPAKLSVGQSLKDGSITITSVGSQLPMNMDVTISERTVEAKETITTPAGTFDCYKIKSKMHIKNQVGITMNFDFSAIEWLAPNGGMIKSESYNKNGKLVGSTLLIEKK